MKNLRLLSLIMAILMVAAVAFSCTGSNDSKSTTTPGSSNTAATTAPQSSSSSSSEEGNTEEPSTPGIPEGMITVNQPFTDNFDLTTEGTIYWEYFGEYWGAIDDQKKDATDRIGEVDFQGGAFHYDNKATVTWNDGTLTATMEEPLRSGRNASTSIDLTFTDLTDCSTIKFFVGAYQATIVIELYDEDENVIGSMDLFTCESDAQISIVTLDLSKYEGTKLGVRFTPDGSNVSMTAITIS